MEEWRFVFWSTAGVAVLGSLTYGLFSSSELVPWDSLPSQEIEIKERDKQILIFNGNQSEKVESDKEANVEDPLLFSTDKKNSC